MKSTDEIHKITEAVYKNLVENFNNGVRQLLLTGKTYHKALLGVTAAAHAYNDALARIGSMAKMCRGGTDEIGGAILQIAEAQKSIQAQLEESTKSLFSDLILPMEQKLDKEFKRAHSDAKKYSQGHKVVLAPYSKAFDSLKKFRKKTKNKYVYDNEKEAQHMRTLSKCQEKLDEYRVQGLRIALMEERKCHCFLLQRLCAISGVNAIGHQRGLDLYSTLAEWRDLCANPHVLPLQAEQFIVQQLDDDDAHVNGGPGYHSNGFLHRDMRDQRDQRDPRETQSLADGIRRSKSTQDLFRRSGHFDGTKTLPPRTHGIPPPPTIRPQVQAAYSFSSNVESQLSFIEGDIITLMGEKSDGWQYGENTRSQMLGWFPLSFTQPIAINQGRESPEFRLTEQHRGKSVGDLLDSRSLSEHHHYMYEHDIPGNVRRPKSLYDGPSTQHNSPQAVRPTYPFTALYDPIPTYSHQGPIFNPFSDPDQIYQAIPGPHDNLQQHSLYTRRDQTPSATSATYSAYGQPIKTAEKGFTPVHPSRSSPPLPPPPPPDSNPPHLPPSTTFANQPDTAGVRRVMTGVTAPAAPSLPAPNPPFLPPFPPPPSSLPPQPPSGTLHAKSSHASNLTSPPTISAKPSLTSMSLLSHQSTQVTAGTSGTGYGSPARQPAKPPPPPPPPPQAPWNQPEEDYGIEDNTDFKTNPMFSTVSLRRTRTNDRSAPKLN